jgi:hypothetical protein
MSNRRMLWRAGVLCSVLLMTGCAPGAARSSTRASPATTATVPAAAPGGTASDSFAGPPPIVLKDTAPDLLALSLYLTVGGYDAATRDTTELDVVFARQGRTVRFVAGERLACNGRALPSYGTNFDLKVPSELFSGKLVTCTYTSGTRAATFTFTAPLAPAIISPHDGAQVARSPQTPVAYRLSPDWAFSLVALGFSTKAWTPTALSQPNPVLMNTSALAPGIGSIALSQFFTLSDLRGPAFQAVEGRGGATYAIQVTWV